MQIDVMNYLKEIYPQWNNTYEIGIAIKSNRGKVSKSLMKLLRWGFVEFKRELKLDAEAHVRIYELKWRYVPD